MSRTQATNTNLGLIGSKFLKLDQTTPQTTVGTFFLPRVEVGALTGFTGDPVIPLNVGVNTNSYAGVYVQNLNSGDTASSDIVLGANNDTVGVTGHYIDVGMGSSGYVGADVGWIRTVSINAGGSGYRVGDVLTPVGGDSNAALTVLTLSGSAVATVSVTNNGSGYIVASGLDTTVDPAGGSGCKINILTLWDSSLYGANDGYMFVSGGNLLVGTDGSSTGKVIKFHTSGAGLVNERMRITDTGVGVATITPVTAFHVAMTTTASPRGIMSSQHNNGTDGARIHMRKSRGTNASPTVIATGDNLGRLVASGYDGANYLEMGGIDIVSSGTIASTRVPTEIRFLTATNATPSVLTQRMVIDSAGNIGVGTTVVTNTLSFGGNTARTFWLERHTTANTAGNSLTIQAGGATSGATDKAGGNMLYKTGISTGTGSASHVFYVYPAQLVGGVKTISATPTAGGSGYTAGDTLTITTGGGNATVTVDTVDGSGAVTAFVTTPVAAGTGYSVSTGNATSGGTGTSATVNITVITGTADGTLTQVMAISGSGVSNSLTLASPVVQTWSVLTNTCLAAPAYNTAATYYGAVNDARMTTNVNLTSTAGGLTGLNCLVRHQGSGTITSMHGLRVYSEITGGGVVTNLRGVIALTPTYTSGTVGSASGFYVQNQGNAAVTNSYGLYLEAQSGSVTGNYAIYAAGTADKSYFGGNIGIGTTGPSALIHGIKTTEQLRLGYDTSNYYSTTVSSVGLVTFNGVGTGAMFKFNQSVGIGVAPTSTYGLSVSNTVNLGASAVGRGLSFITYDDSDTSNTHYTQGLVGIVYSRIGTGVTNSGYIQGGNIGSLHQGDGTVAISYGAVMATGNYGSGGADTTGTITTLYGTNLTLYNRTSATIGTAYGHYLVLPAVGTVGTAYGYYVAASSNNTTSGKYGFYSGALSGTGTANYGMYLGAVSGATSNYSIYSNGGSMFHSGIVGIGAAPVSTTQLYVYKQFTDALNAYKYGINLTMYSTPTDHTTSGHGAFGALFGVTATGAYNSYAIYGFRNDAHNSSTGTTTVQTASLNNAGSTIAAGSTATSTTVTVGSFSFYPYLQGTYNVTNFYGVHIAPAGWNSTAGYTGTINITAAYGINIGSMVTSGGATWTIGSKYGLYIGAISGATTNNYAIYSVGGASYHAGSFNVGTAATYTANRLFRAVETYTSTSGVVRGGDYSLTLNPSDTTTTTSTGLYLQAVTTSGNAQVMTGASLYGADMNVYHQGTGTLGTGVAGNFALINSNTGIITTAYVLKGGVTNSGGGSFTNLYGLYLGDVSAGTSINSAITTNAGNIVFNEGGDASTDFRVESDTEANMLFLDADADTDGALYFGGTTNGVKINKGGELTMLGTATVWNDANVGGLVLRTGGTAPGVVEILDNDGDATGIYTVGFAVNEQGSGVIEIPHDYKEGSNITFHIHWGANDAPAGGTDNVKWQLTYSIARGANTFPDAVTPTAVEVAYTTQYQYLFTNIATITGSTGGVGGGNITIGDQFHFTIKRIAASADEFGGEALMGTLGLHYEADTIGSKTISAK